MATWNIVFPYSADDRDGLREEGYPCPEVVEGNRAPTAGEVHSACERIQTVLGHQLSPLDCFDPGFNWNNPEAIATSLRMGGPRLGDWYLLLELSRTCGQLFFMPGSGPSAVVIEPGMDAEVIAAVYEEASNHEDGWQYVFRSLYLGRTGVNDTGLA
jgi:hypothetical protein